MPSIKVAYRQQKVSGVPKRFASGSMTTLKEKMREHPGTRWLVATYVIKADVATICQAIADVKELEADSVENYRVNAQGQLRRED